ncbi:MAG TPA: hypothetical protein VGY54_16170, partial [Polyangiaceae bacterium]|nr:hypothetical protein [Polyangiaceae bacterium]
LHAVMPLQLMACGSRAFSIGAAYAPASLYGFGALLGLDERTRSNAVENDAPAATRSSRRPGPTSGGLTAGGMF